MLKILVLFGLVTALAACATLGWYGQAVRGQLEILTQREDIAELIADPDTPEQLREQLALALEIRAFASDELGLPDNRSYTVYTDLERDAVVWNVIAAPEFDLSPKTWCYPFAGCLAYRGYFREHRARELAADLARQGYDALVAPVPAYSTLGRFADPVFNTMLEFDDTRLAGLIFHELAHQRVFVKGDTRFNESYATFVEREGVRRWLTSRGDPEALEQWRARQQIGQQFNELLLDTRRRLERLYAQDLDPETMRARKLEEFEQLRDRYREFRRRHSDHRHDRYMARELNNADLALVAAYQSGTGAFAALLAEYGDDLNRFHEAVDELAGADPDRRAEFLMNPACNYACRDNARASDPGPRSKWRATNTTGISSPYQ